MMTDNVFCLRNYDNKVNFKGCHLFEKYMDFKLQQFGFLKVELGEAGFMLIQTILQNEHLNFQLNWLFITTYKDAPIAGYSTC